MAISRTLEDLHSREYGHNKFAKVCDLLTSENHIVSDIVEYYEKFKFKVDDFSFQYDKSWKASAKSLKDYIVRLLDMKKELEQKSSLT